ncbi:hypothetical protein TI39_contig295g00009 [Zymoseptoria brevis]|uniref:Uncharacterized protein n=1 Tax=Zymoseptoria brevis TaxID=1047168 RepID=A0A0F4GVR9_9PEZI|nr:hypothetical protein TI39_contig295g00009 [Zymoseptoria brevis]
MFARHARTRMRSSGVVQGLKSLASKLHPQLPLTARESNSLLNTLTSSFRKHLDEAHPTAAEETKSVAKGVKEEARAPTRIHHVQSAAASADDHLIKLLTNPLLSRRGRGNVLDYDTAKAELAKSSSEDPIELLERYQEKGAASVRIAELCLNTAWKHLLSLPETQRTQYIKSIEPGRRALRWLLMSKAYESEDFWKSPKIWTHESQTSGFTERATKFLLLEGQEETAWQWLSLDLPGLEANHELLRTKQLTAEQADSRLARYAWRGQIIEAIASHRLVGRGYDLWYQQSSTSPEANGLNGAIDVFIRACELRLSVDTEHHLHWTPVRGTFYKLVGATRHRSKLRRDIDVAKFERLCELSICTASPGHPMSKFWQSFLAADFQLWHPKGRRPLPVYHCLRDNGFRSHLVQEMANPGVSAILFRAMVRTIYELNRQGYTDKATDLYSAAKDAFPGFADFSSDWTARLERGERKDRADAKMQHGIKTFSFGRLDAPVPSLT